MQDDSHFTRGNAYHRLELSELVIVDLYRFPEKQIPIYKDFFRQYGCIAVGGESSMDPVLPPSMIP